MGWLPIHMAPFTPTTRRLSLIYNIFHIDSFQAKEKKYFLLLLENNWLVIWYVFVTCHGGFSSTFGESAGFNFLFITYQ